MVLANTYLNMRVGIRPKATIKNNAAWYVGTSEIKNGKK
jgi:hypothetical protein